MIQTVIFYVVKTLLIHLFGLSHQEPQQQTLQSALTLLVVVVVFLTEVAGTLLLILLMLKARAGLYLLLFNNQLVPADENCLHYTADL